METVLFLVTIAVVFLLSLKIVIRISRHEEVVSSFQFLAFTLCGYGLLWLIFYLISGEKAVPLGTDVCFDDWCITVTKVDQVTSLKGIAPAKKMVDLHIKMSNHARGIAQKPSEPRIHILDQQGHTWAFSTEGQAALERVIGKQLPIDHRLALHQSLETHLVFVIPDETKRLKILIEEGPFITNLLLPNSKKVFFTQL